MGHKTDPQPNTHLETSGAPIHKLDGAPGLDVGDGCVDVLGDHVAAVQHAARHIHAVTGVALDHLICWLEAGAGDLQHGELLVVGLLGRDDGGVGNEWEVDTGKRHQVGLELRQVHVEGAVEAQWGGDGGDDLSDKPVEVDVAGVFDVHVAVADVVDGLVVHHEGAVGVLQGGVGGEDGVVRLHHGRGHLGSWVDGELQLGLLAVVYWQALHQQGGEARAGATSKAVEYQEPL